MYLFLMGLGLEVVGYMKNFFFFFAFILRYLGKSHVYKRGIKLSQVIENVTKDIIIPDT